VTSADDVLPCASSRRSASVAVVSEVTPAPIKYEYTLPCNAEHAFATYASRIGEWWDPRYTANVETLEDVTIEPRVGGRVYATHRDTGEDDWGVVTVWEPGRRLAHTFTLAQNPERPSCVDVEFVPGDGRGEPDGCTMRFAHGGWSAATAAVRDKFGDWPVILDRFATLAESGA
jgi:Activator of Hsp90 ATPase homolog 1-like protein